MLRLYRDSSPLEKKDKNKLKVAIDAKFYQNHNNNNVQYNRCNKY